MRRWICSILFFLTGVCLLHAGEGASDLDRMQGTWQVVSLVEEGKAVPAAEIDVLEVVIDKNEYSMKEKGKIIARYSLKLDPQKTPRTIDFTHVQGDRKGKTELAIYAFDKDLFKLVIDESDKGRPTAFEGKETAAWSVMVLKKKEPKKDE
jgi:uncharacterized protein (TIGR03067 family)